VRDIGAANRAAGTGHGNPLRYPSADQPSSSGDLIA
jgi:hypothetical protein